MLPEKLRYIKINNPSIFSHINLNHIEKYINLNELDKYRDFNEYIYGNIKYRLRNNLYLVYKK